MTPATVASLIFGLTFLAVGLTALVVWLFLDQRPERQTDDERGLLRADRLSTLKFLANLLERVHLSERLRKLIDEADLEWSVGRVTLLMALAGVVVFAVLVRLSFLPLWMSILISGGVAAGPLMYVQAVRDKRLRQVEDQLPEALEYISRALVAGHSLPLSMELLAEETGPPLAGELRKTVDEYNLGMPLERALENLAQRLPSVDIQFFASAIMTQSRTGGSLHEVLEGLAETIRERATLKGQVRALTANGRITAVVLSLLPLFIALVMFVTNGSYFMILLTHPLGKTLVTVALCAQVAAFFVIRRIVDIRI